MTDWCLINPEGVVLGEAFQFPPRPKSLHGKTIMLRWNGKHNGDVFLNRIADLLTREGKGIRIIRNWDVALETRETSSSPERSREFARKLSVHKPDIVIAATGD